MGQVDDGRADEVVERWRAVPRIVFLDSCRLQWLHDYGGFVWEDEPVLRPARRRPSRMTLTDNAEG
jgi:hypothetical protein